MGKGSSSQVVAPAEQEPIVTPAVARSIAADTESAQIIQAQERERLRGISNTCRRYSSTSQNEGNSTLGGR
jgi:hypothetical protein